MSGNELVVLNDLMAFMITVMNAVVKFVFSGWFTAVTISVVIAVISAKLWKMLLIA